MRSKSTLMPHALNVVSALSHPCTSAHPLYLPFHPHTPALMPLQPHPRTHTPASLPVPSPFYLHPCTLSSAPSASSLTLARTAPLVDPQSTVPVGSPPWGLPQVGSGSLRLPEVLWVDLRPVLRVPKESWDPACPFILLYPCMVMSCVLVLSWSCPASWDHIP